MYRKLSPCEYLKKIGLLRLLVYTISFDTALICNKILNVKSASLHSQQFLNFNYILKSNQKDTKLVYN